MLYFIPLQRKGLRDYPMTENLLDLLATLVQEAVCAEVA